MRNYTCHSEKFYFDLTRIKYLSIFYSNVKNKSITLNSIVGHPYIFQSLIHFKSVIEIKLNSYNETGVYMNYLSKSFLK